MDTPVATRSKLVVANSTPDMVVTDDICSVCYIDKDLVSQNEIRQLHDLGGAQKNKKHEPQQKE
eukprot:15222327-Ditylum_brightwellii.AAC.1